MKKNEYVSARLFDELYFKYQKEIHRRVVAESNVKRLHKKIQESKSGEDKNVEENEVHTEISKADKMFGDLGYWKREYPDRIMYYKYREDNVKNGDEFEVFYFYLKRQISEEYIKRNLSTKELKAIKEKMKELGWND